MKSEIDKINIKDLDIIDNWKKKSYKIGVTNGCFDLFHRGHKFSINQAKYFCDRLIVLINSDKSIKKIKGILRPIQNERLRKKNILKNKNVDMVFIFKGSTPFKMIKQIKPNFLFKGSDYRNKNIVGSRYVKDNGGKVKILKNIKGLSTTKLITKL
tara:strand:+ start:570 stop:1037 length:468 start_codon:yes stop_codon:yes gene_type:complete